MYSSIKVGMHVVLLKISICQKIFMQHHAKILSNNTYKSESSHAMHESQEHGDAAL